MTKQPKSSDLTPDEMLDMIKRHKFTACGTCLGFNPETCKSCVRYITWVFDNVEDVDIAASIIKSIEIHYRDIQDKENGLFTLADYDRD